LLDIVDGGIPEGHTLLEVAWAAGQKWIDFDMFGDHEAVPATLRTRLNAVGDTGGFDEDGPDNTRTFSPRRNWEGYKIALNQTTLMRGTTNVSLTHSLTSPRVLG